MKNSIIKVSAVLLLLTLAAYQLPHPTAFPESSPQINVEVLGSLLVVDLYLCIEESYASVKAVGLPIAILQVTPQYVYAVIEGGNISILASQQPECVRVRYVSESISSGDVLRVSYPGRTSKLTIIINLSIAVPTHISPEPSDVYTIGGSSVAMVWQDVEGVMLDYIIVEYVRAGVTPTTATATTAELTVTATTTTVPTVIVTTVVTMVITTTEVIETLTKTRELTRVSVSTITTLVPTVVLATLIRTTYAEKPVTTSATVPAEATSPWTWAVVAVLVMVLAMVVLVLKSRR